MSRTLRKILATVVVALHAAVVACGPGLHSIPGLGHVARATGESSADDHSVGVGSATASGDHCPLCDYFAQAQLVSISASFLSARLGSPCGRTPAAPGVALGRSLDARPRAPPGDDVRIIAPTAPMARFVPSRPPTPDARPAGRC